MDNTTTPLFGEKRMRNAVFLVLIVLAGVLFVQMVTNIREYTYVGAGIPATNTITVSGEGEAFAVADTAVFTFSVIEEADTVAEAQEAATEKMNRALELLDEADIAERDIKTVSYNIYPQYDYIQEVCTEFRCPPGERRLRGYEVSQSVQVKVRKTEDAGEILSEIGSIGVQNVSGLLFQVDDEDVPQREAREQAIADAEAKAQALANDLGVRLVRVVAFNENGSIPYFARSEAMAMDSAVGNGTAAPAPQLPVGENRIISNVTITYEIR